MADTGLGIMTVMFGEEIPGTGVLAPSDMVILHHRDPGTEDSGTAICLPAHTAMTVAAEIAAAVGRLANTAVDDQGNRLSLPARLARLRPES